MAEQSAHDVVNQNQSVGDLSPSDASASQTNHQVTGGGEGGDQAADKNGFESQPQPSTGASEANRLKLGGDVVTNGLSHKPQATNGPEDLSSTTEPFRTASEDITSAADGLGLADNVSVSDTDTSRAEGSAAEDGKGPDQPAALKKTASFKPVNFAKQKLFPVSKGIGAAAGVKATETKANIPSSNSSTVSLTQGSRPRLVAKSTSGLGNSAKNSKASVRNGAIPDPMQVWNKNRVTPQTSTKHLTDEELKQQYGIHMTSRIQADGEGKESKWADIDDDEDDWAPETIEWGDGTKVTVNQADVIPPATQTGKPESTTTEEDKPAQPVKIVPPLTTTTIGPNATVLRVGASAERQQAQKAATLQKGPTEKPIQSTSKAPAPPPSKSPWAALPPVDKVSPVAINPQLSMPQPTRYFNNQGSLQSPSTMASQSPAKEISADDFNRSWRDSQNSQPRELYMPNSGRYEAVNESRRRGSRNDQNFRAPAVLQRPSQSDQHTPAEPSAAFQTHRSSTEQDRAPWARRRASSNVSATSGQYGRRMSVTKLGDRDLSAVSSEGAQERRGSHATASDSVGSQDIPPPPVPTAAYRPQGFSNVQQMPRQPSFNADQAPANAPPPAAAADLEAERALQKQLMREKRELAIKRRQEEEARLEAEKKERIRLKLEAMGPPPEKGKQQETPIANQEARVSASAPPTQSPPKPPIPEASGQPTQYGLMKLHPPDVTRAPASIEQHPEMVLPPSDIAGPLSEPALNIPNPSSTITNGVRPSPEPQPTKMSRDAPLDDRVVQTSKASSMVSESRSPWPSSRVDHRPPPTNLWGPPTNNKALGNGTFDQSLAGFPSREFGAREPPWKNGRLAAERSPQLMPATTHVPMDRTPSLPSFAPSEQSPLAANSEIDSVLPQSRPAPIGPPQAQQASQRWQASPNLGPVAATVAAWNNFSAVVAQDDRAENERAQHELAIRREEDARTGVRRAPQYTFNETWKQIEAGDQAGQRQVIGVAQSNFNPSMLTGTQFGAVGALPVTDLGSRPVNSLLFRSSRFFPQPTDNTSGQNRRAVTYSHPEPSADSPPPPPAEEFGSPHPAYDGDFRHPIVQLPPKKPVVKLPPAPSSTPPSVSAVPDRPPVVAAPLSFAAAVKTQPAPQPPPPPPPPAPPQPQPSLRAVSTPIAATASWQDRFNGLFGRHTQPERKDQVLAVTSASKEPLDVLPINVSASVSLPQLEDDILKDAGKATSKDVEDEEEIFEDRVTGDLPTIKIPQALPAALPAARMPFVRPKPKILPQLIDPLSVMPLMVELLGGYPPNSKKGDFITIRLPGATEELLKELPRKGSSSSASRSKTSRNISSSFSTKHKRGATKSRDSSATHSQSSQGSKSGLTQQSQPNGSVPSPRPVQNQGQRFRGGRQATGVVH